MAQSIRDTIQQVRDAKEEQQRQYDCLSRALFSIPPSSNPSSPLFFTFRENDRLAKIAKKVSKSPGIILLTAFLMVLGMEHVLPSHTHTHTHTRCSHCHYCHRYWYRGWRAWQTYVLRSNLSRPCSVLTNSTTLSLWDSQRIRRYVELVLQHRSPLINRSTAPRVVTFRVHTRTMLCAIHTLCGASSSRKWFEISNKTETSLLSSPPPPPPLTSVLLFNPCRYFSDEICHLWLLH